MTFTYGSSGPDASQNPGSGPSSASGCTAAADCLAHPVIQEIGALPAGTSAPNTVITEHAMRAFHISSGTSDWLVQGSQPFTAAQISNAELAASTTQISVEAKNDQPSSSAVIGWATVFGIIIALGVLGMSVGLVRSETSNDLRTLAAAGASSYTRRTLTAVTAGALGFLGALLGVMGGYIGMIGWLRSNSLNGGVAALGNIPCRPDSSFSSACRPLRRSSAGCSPAASRRPWPARRSNRPGPAPSGATRTTLPSSGPIGRQPALAVRGGSGQGA